MEADGRVGPMQAAPSSSGVCRANERDTCMADVRLIGAEAAPQTRPEAGSSLKPRPIFVHPRSGNRIRPATAARITRMGSRLLNLMTNAMVADAMPAVGQSTIAPRARTIVAPAMAPAAAAVAPLTKA